MTHLKILIVITTLLLFTACKKNHTITLQAQNLTNSADGSHYAGMKYGVFERGYTFSDNNNVLAKGTLNQNGKAVFDVKLNRNLDYVLGIQKPDNVCYTEITLEYPIEFNEDNTINFDYSPCGYLRPLEKNINCEGNTDEFRFKFHYSDDPDIYIYTGFTSGANHYWNTVFFLEGCFDNTNTIENSAFEIPEGNYTYEWQVVRPSGTTTGIDYFTVTENDTTTYILEY